MIEEATSGIIETGVVSIILVAGMILMYRYFSAEVKRLNSIIKAKDEEIKELTEQLRDLMVKDIEVSTKFNTTLEQLTKIIENGR